jgi:hypothetical protein
MKMMFRFFLPTYAYNFPVIINKWIQKRYFQSSLQAPFCYLTGLTRHYIASETANWYPAIRIFEEVLAERNWSNSIPMDSKVAYLNSEVLSISRPVATPPVVFMA